MRRGEIYYIESRFNEEGSEQRAGRPAVIVSNDLINSTSSVVEVVYLTTQPKNDMITHVDVRSASRPSVALCEQISSVSTDRIGDYLCTCSEYEMTMIDIALAMSLGLNFDEPKKKEKPTTAAAPVQPTPPKQDSVDEYLLHSLEVRNDNLATALIKTEAERDTYKTLYEGLLAQLIGNR